MLDTLKNLGIFFTYSPKRSERLEKAVEEYNSGKSKSNEIKKKQSSKFSVKLRGTLENFMDMYEPLIMSRSNCKIRKGVG